MNVVHTVPSEERTYWKRWKQSRDTHSGDELVKIYTPLVTYHVQRLASVLPSNVSREDVRSFGFMGLLDALDKFDLTRNLKFDTYASFRIRGAIMDGLRKEDWLPRNARDRAKKIESIQTKLEQKYMRHVSVEEIAQKMDLPVKEVEKAMDDYFFAHIFSIDEHLSDPDGDDEKHSYVIEDDETLTPEEQLIKSEWLEEMAEVITKLTKNEQLVLSLFYKEELTLTEIGKILELSTSRVSQIHSKAISELKRMLLKNR